MADQEKIPERGSPEFREWLRKKAAEEWEKTTASPLPDFDETGVIFGSERSITASDAELFPDEIEEYTPEERKPRLVPKK